MSDYMISQPEQHHCHWIGCKVQVPPKMYACRRHWYMLPESIRNEIWRYYRPGQEVTKDPSRAYIEAARMAEKWILENYPETRRK